MSILKIVSTRISVEIRRISICVLYFQHIGNVAIDITIYNTTLQSTCKTNVTVSMQFIIN